MKSLPLPSSPVSPPTTPSPQSALPVSVLNFPPAPVFLISTAATKTSPASPSQPDSDCNDESSQQPTSQLCADIDKVSRSSDRDRDPFVVRTTPTMQAAQPVNDRTPSRPSSLSPRHITTTSTPSRPNAQASASSASRASRSPRIASVEREMAQGPALVWRRAQIALRSQAGLESPALPRSPRRASANICSSPSPDPCNDVETKISTSGFEDDFLPSPVPVSEIASPTQAVVIQAGHGRKSIDGGAVGLDNHDEDPFTVKRTERMTVAPFDSQLQSDIDGWCGATEGVLVWRFYDDLGRTTTLLQTPTRGGSVTESVV